MNFGDVIKKSVLEGFSYTDFSTTKMAVTLGITFCIALYIFFIYRMITRSTFYDKTYNISMAMMSVVTSGIIMAMQSSLVISLGMVGALSIVRFRTAIKEPMELLFLFWSIGSGIICGAGLYELAMLVALAATAGIFILQVIPLKKSPYLLIVQSGKNADENEIMKVAKQYSPSLKIDSKSVTPESKNLILEVRAGKANEMADKVAEVEGVTSVTLMHYEGEVKS